MSAINFRRFSKLELLKRIAPNHLIAFFAPYSEYLKSRGLTLPTPEAAADLDYPVLSSILLTPDARTPHNMVEALYYINEMSTQEGFDQIQNAIAGKEIDSTISDDATYGELALQIWLYDHELIERLHAEQFILRPRSFEYFLCARGETPVFSYPNSETISALEADLDDWFAQKRRGRVTKVFVYKDSKHASFLIRHGMPYSREAVIKDGESSSLHYQPEKYDVLIYNCEDGELRINANSKGEKELYRTMLGLHFFGDSEFFSGTSKFTLEPLREAGEKSLLCDDIYGIDWIHLKELQGYFEGTYSASKTWKSENVFAALEAQGVTIPQSCFLTKASFQIKFSASKTPRMVTFFAGNRAQFKRDDDADILEEWLSVRGFIIEVTHDDIEE